VPLLPGLPDVVPLLLSVGLAAIAAYCALLLARVVRRAPAALQGIELVRDRRPTRAGLGFAALAVPLALLWVRGGWLQVEADRAGIAQRRELAQRAERSARAGEAYQRGVAHAQRGELSEAAAQFEAALALAPDFVEARENLAGMLCAAGRFAEGIAHYREALRLRPGDADTLVLLGRAHAETGDLDAAAERWEEALRLRPDHAAAHAALAILCEQRGDAEGARRHRAAAAIGGR
jgi:tetratricopeptide (TPR) repeat protein